MRARLLRRYLATLTSYGGVGTSPSAVTETAPGPSQLSAQDSSSDDSISFHSDESNSAYQPPPQPYRPINDTDTTFSMDLSPPPPGNRKITLINL